METSLKALRCDSDGDLFIGDAHLFMPSVGIGSVHARDFAPRIVRACNAHDDLAYAAKGSLKFLRKFVETTGDDEARAFLHDLEKAVAKAEGK